MRYANIDNCEICNGEGVGISLFVQGCPIHCKDCFNQEAWDFNGGKEWTAETQEEFLNLADKSYITRISILGGEPLEEKNRKDVFRIIERVHNKVPDKNIWLWTSYTFEEILEQEIIPKDILSMIDVIVDGPFVIDKRDLKLKYRGSSNQRIVDVKESLNQDKIILWENEYNENNVYSGHTFRKIK